MNEQLQPVAPREKDAMGLIDGPGRVRDLGSYPLRLFAPDMAELFGVSLNRFYKLAREGAFDFCAHPRPHIGRRSWDRERVRQWFAGEIRGLTAVKKRA